jgi:hypothetical protein
MRTRIMQPLDSDSLEIKMDNCCSKTLSGHKNDFIKGTLVPIKNMVVQGYSATGEYDYVTHEGIIQWSVPDDDGKLCNITIPKSLYVPTNGHRLLLPQHVAQQMKGKETDTASTQCITFAD